MDEDLDAGGRGVGRRERDLHIFAFSEYGFLVGMHNPRALGESSCATAPSGDEAEFAEGAGKLFGVDGIKEADEQLAKIRAEHPQIYVQVTPGYVDRLRERFDSLVGQREAVAATQTLQDLFDRKKIRHDGSQILQEHFANSNISRRQGGWVLTAPMGRSGVYAARAAMFAVSQAAKAPMPVAMIRSRRRA